MELESEKPCATLRSDPPHKHDCGNRQGSSARLALFAKKLRLMPAEKIVGCCWADSHSEQTAECSAQIRSKTLSILL